MNKTPWFPISVNPVRVGLYEYRFAEFRFAHKCHWDGDRWVRPGGVPLEIDPGDAWRGLAEPPK